MDIVNDVPPDKFIDHEIRVYACGARLVIVINNRDRCLARLTLPPLDHDDTEPIDIIVYEPRPTPTRKP